MAKTHWAIIFVTFLISCISLAILIVSICTSYWIVASAKHQSATRDSEVHYGLFSGSLSKYVLSSGSNYDLTITCDYGEGACIYSCQQSENARQDELRRILNKEPVLTCPTARNAARFLRSSDAGKAMFDGVDIQNDNGTIMQKQGNDQPDNEQYIISGYWASTVTFISFSIIFTTFSAILSIVNVIFNPVELIFNIFGLYVWNALSATSMILVLILWGVLFDTSLQYNIAITDTLQSPTPYSSDGLATMGYSCWIIFAPLTFCVVNISLLLFRKYLIEKRAPPPTITVERNDYTIMLY
ncbi:unnamed protein product [Hermetia illucens]|uniref:Uncharacterized protein n=1 Tax=Hermetia illucens TaxID=343691 RepID=A0A7R8UQ17_HERIL|nr:uncharacterized protein LOC119653156 [Hermetia illucens]CAD7084899.1 unnamed protein product [Hermetia illucens]